MKQKLTSLTLAILTLLLLGLWIPTYAVDIDSLMETMTMKQKIGQMILVYHSPYKFLKKYEVGGVLIMYNMLTDPAALGKELDSIQKNLPIGLLVTIDQEGGKINRLGKIKEWEDLPSAKQMAAFSTDSIEAIMEPVAAQLKDLNINTNLAPVLDPVLNWKGDTSFMEVRNRSFGTGEAEIVPRAKAFIKGNSSHDILCIAKHFPGYDAATNSDHAVAISKANEAAVETYARPFSLLIDDLGGVLMSSILFDNFCKNPAVLSPKMVAKAHKLAPEKIVMTDDLWGAALRSFVSGKEKVHPVNYPDKDFCKLVKMAFWAGNDMLMITFPKKVELIEKTLLKLSKKKKARKRIDESVRRILLTKQKLGLLK